MGPRNVAVAAAVLAATGCADLDPRRSHVATPEQKEAWVEGEPLRPEAGDGDGSVRFIAVGDIGTGDDVQERTAAAMAETCAEYGCDFVLLLGDNIYENGVEDPDDYEWVTHFEDPFRDLDVPFFAVLGNHDYGGKIFGKRKPGVGNQWRKGVYQIEYADESDKFEMPAPFYTVLWGDVGIIALDTNSIIWKHRDFGDQREWYPRALANLDDAKWKIAFGHHAYLSNGVHGNAGRFDLIEVRNREVRVPLKELNGKRLRRFFEDQMCGTVDIYFAGHDHNRQWLDAPDALCGTELVVSGAGGKLKGLKGEQTPAYWQDDREHGFFYGVIEGDTFTGHFIDADGDVRFARTFERGQAQPKGDQPVARTSEPE